MSFCCSEVSKLQAGHMLLLWKIPLQLFLSLYINTSARGLPFLSPCCAYPSSNKFCFTKSSAANILAASYLIKFNLNKARGTTCPCLCCRSHSANTFSSQVPIKRLESDSWAVYPTAIMLLGKKGLD